MTTTHTPTPDTRNASLADLANLLRDQHARKLDLVVPASCLRAEGGLLVVEGAEPIVDEDGVTTADGRYRPTAVADEGLAEKLSIPVQYLKRTREERPDIYDANVNGWLHGFRTPEGVEPCENDPRYAAGDRRSFLLRTFRGDDGGEGIARALLSSKYRCIDNLDVLTAALEGVKDAGVDVDIAGCDLSERRMYVRVVAPEVQALAPQLLKGYRPPAGLENGGRVRTGRLLNEDYNPETVFAGFRISNSEVGGGMWTITPEITVLVCLNGMTRTQDALKQVHIGGKLEDGIIRFSDDTQRKSIELVRAQTRDAVATFLDVEYLKSIVADVETKAGTEIEGDVQEHVKTVCKTLKFSDEHTAGILDHFIRGGQLTAGGVANAITSYSQLIPDADTADEFDGLALRALDLAAAR